MKGFPGHGFWVASRALSDAVFSTVELLFADAGAAACAWHGRVDCPAFTDGHGKFSQYYECLVQTAIMRRAPNTTFVLNKGQFCCTLQRGSSTFREEYDTPPRPLADGVAP